MADTTPVAPKDQGPNEQSIVASGMTVEEWEQKHPKQPLGPAPEDIDQVTTDPPDGSEVTLEASQEAAEKAFPNQATNPDVALDGAPGRSVVDQPNPDPDADAGEAPGHSGLTTHAQLDAYAKDQGTELPEDWHSKTVAGKKAYLDG